MRTLCVTTRAMILSALLAGASYAEQQTVLPVAAAPQNPAAPQSAGGAPPQGGPKLPGGGLHRMRPKLGNPPPGADSASRQTAPAGPGMPAPGGPTPAGVTAQKALPPSGRHGRSGSGAGAVTAGRAGTTEVADDGVDPSIQLHPAGPRHLHGAPPSALSKAKGARPELGAYTKKYQHHPGENSSTAVNPASGGSHASVPGESLKEQESKLHRMANPQGSAAEASSVSRHASAASAVLTTNSAPALSESPPAAHSAPSSPASTGNLPVVSNGAPAPGRPMPTGSSPVASSGAPPAGHPAALVPVSKSGSAPHELALIPTAGHHSPNVAIIDGKTTTSRTHATAAIGGVSLGGSH